MSIQGGDSSLMRSMLPIILTFNAVVISSCTMQNLATATPAPEVSAEQLWDEHDANVDKFDSERVGSWVRVYGIVRDVGNERVDLFVDQHFFRPKVVLLHGLSREQRAEAVKNAPFSATCEVSTPRWHERYLSVNPIHLRDCRR